MGNKESNESAAVKRQAEGGSNPMYELLDLSGKFQLALLRHLRLIFVLNRWRHAVPYYQKSDGKEGLQGVGRGH